MPDNPSGQLTASSGIGALRWKVTLYRRDQAPGPDSAIDENLVKIGDVQADVAPSFMSTFYQTTQVDTPVTHIITCRWLDYLPTIDVVARTTLRPTPRTELYRVRRTKEIAGRKRFLQMECELEHSRFVPDDSDAERNRLLTEPYPAETASIWDGGASIWDLDQSKWDRNQ